MRHNTHFFALYRAWQLVLSYATAFVLDQVPGQAHSFIEHIQTGIQHAEHDPDALLLFSGGQTRKAAGPRSEAEGYWLVAEAARWWGSTLVRERAFTEVQVIPLKALQMWRSPKYCTCDRGMCCC